MTPERKFVLGVDRLLKAVLFALFVAVAVACLAGPGTPNAPVLHDRIGQGTAAGPGFAPVQRGAVTSAPAEDDISSAFFRTGLKREYLSGNWTESGSRVSVLSDTALPAENATQTSAAQQPYISADGYLECRLGQWLVMPPLDCATTTIMVQYRVSASATATDYGEGMAMMGCDFSPQLMCLERQDMPNYLRVLFSGGAGGYFSTGPILGSPPEVRTIGMCVSPVGNNLIFAGSDISGLGSDLGLTTGPITYNRIGSYNGSRNFYGEIRAVWVWDRMFTLDDLKKIAAIAHRWSR